MFPLNTYHNNITGTFDLCEVMRESSVLKNSTLFSKCYGYTELRQCSITEDALYGVITNPLRKNQGRLSRFLTDIHATAVRCLDILTLSEHMSQAEQ